MTSSDVLPLKLVYIYMWS